MRVIPFFILVLLFACSPDDNEISDVLGITNPRGDLTFSDSMTLDNALDSVDAGTNYYYCRTKDTNFIEMTTFEFGTYIELDGTNNDKVAPKHIDSLFQRIGRCVVEAMDSVDNRVDTAYHPIFVGIYDTEENNQSGDRLIDVTVGIGIASNYFSESGQDDPFHEDVNLWYLGAHDYCANGTSYPNRCDAWNSICPNENPSWVNECVDAATGLEITINEQYVPSVFTYYVNILYMCWTDNPLTIVSHFVPCDNLSRCIAQGGYVGFKNCRSYSGQSSAQFNCVDGNRLNDMYNELESDFDNNVPNNYSKLRVNLVCREATGGEDCSHNAFAKYSYWYGGIGYYGLARTGTATHPNNMPGFSD